MMESFWNNYWIAWWKKILKSSASSIVTSHCLSVLGDDFKSCLQRYLCHCRLEVLQRSHHGGRVNTDQLFRGIICELPEQSRNWNSFYQGFPCFYVISRILFTHLLSLLPAGCHFPFQQKVASWMSWACELGSEQYVWWLLQNRGFPSYMAF